jgi:hypothetical protein
MQGKERTTYPWREAPNFMRWNSIKLQASGASLRDHSSLCSAPRRPYARRLLLRARRGEFHARGPSSRSRLSVMQGA